MSAGRPVRTVARTARTGPLPRVSVLMPAHEAAATVGAALRSVERQRLLEWECVVVDDGSTDATASRVREAVRRDPRFRLVSLPRSGLVTALNAGLEHCRAPFVARMDADDCMHPERLGRQLERLERDAGLAGVGCGVRLFPRRGLQPGRLAYEAWLNAVRSAEDVRREQFVECPLAHPTLMLRTEVLRCFAYRDRGWPEDYDLVLRLLARGLALDTVAAPLLAWRDHRGRLSRTDRAYSLDAFMRVRAHFLARTFLRGQRSYVLWGHGPTGRKLKAALATLGLHPRRIVEVHPRRIGARIGAAEVIPPEALERPRDAPLVTAVAGLGARTHIRRRLAELGWRELTDYACAA